MTWLKSEVRVSMMGAAPGYGDSLGNSPYGKLHVQAQRDCPISSEMPSRT
jgi:hypothetical protein